MLRSFPTVNVDEAVMLEKARDARNFIAHEGAAFGYVFAAKEQQIRQHLTKLRTAVSDLAKGDNVVSQWVFEIEEKDPVPASMAASYPVLVDTWVFYDVDGT